MPIDIRVYNNMLQATAKVADVATGLELWNRLLSEKSLVPNEITVANLLWTLASVETEEDKISKRSYHYDGNPAELKQLAFNVFEAAKDELKVPINSYILNGLLAVMANHNFVQEAEEIFTKRFTSLGLAHTAATYEIILKMYDAQRSFEKTVELLEEAKTKKLVLSQEAWRAAIRTASLTTNLQTAIQWLKEMVNAGYKPSEQELRALHLRLCEEEKWHLRQEMGKVCLPPVEPSPNPYTDWRQRSMRIAKLLEKVYGKDAPQLATKLD